MLKYLTYEFEVSCEVGMFSVGSSGVPFRERSFLSLPSGSFDSIPRVSSEGFLDSFTPGVWRIRIDPLVSLLEYSGYTHRSSFISTFSKGRGTHWGASCQTRKSRFKPMKQVLTNWPSFPEYYPRPRSNRGEELRAGIAGVPREDLGTDLMNPKPRGILVSLKPTEEALWERPKYRKGKEHESFANSF